MDAPLAQNPLCNPACRACHYKALTYTEQLARKQRWASEQLAPWATTLQAIRPAPESDRLAYRAKSWLRSNVAHGEVSLGMYRAVEAAPGKWAQEFVSWNTCPLHIPAIQSMIATIRAELARVAPDYCERALWGVWMGSPHVVIVARDPLPPALREIHWQLKAPFDRVWFHQAKQVGKKVFQHREFEQLAGPPGGPPIVAFRQVARGLLAEARAAAVAVLVPGVSQVLDLYCGTGDLAELVPREMGWVGIELSGDAVAYAAQLRAGAQAQHVAYVGTVEERLRDPRVLAQIATEYAIYLNPPRTGLGEEARERVLALLAAKPAQRLVYLSCSASSLARDLAALEAAGYRVTRLQPYDFFPQTEHFETLAVLERA